MLKLKDTFKVANKIITNNFFKMSPKNYSKFNFSSSIPSTNLPIKWSSPKEISFFNQPCSNLEKNSNITTKINSQLEKSYVKKGTKLIGIGKHELTEEGAIWLCDLNIMYNESQRELLRNQMREKECSLFLFKTEIPITCLHKKIDGVAFYFVPHETVAPIKELESPPPPKNIAELPYLDDENTIINLMK